MKDIYSILGELKIPFEKYEHPAVFTVEEASQYERGIDAGKCKNLFLRNKKGDKHFLVVVESTKKVDLKKLAAEVGEGRFSFASPERLLEKLGLKPGSVSAFGLIHNTDKSVEVLVDKDFLRHEKVALHPNINTATLVIKSVDFRNFLTWSGNSISYITM